MTSSTSQGRRNVLRALSALPALGAAGVAGVTGVTGVWPRSARAAAPEFVFKYGNNLPVSHPLNIRAQEVAARIAAESRGRMELRVFPNNQLDCWAFAFALGWMVAEARGPRERIACILIGVAAAAIGWGLVNLHTIMLGLAMLLILYFPRLRLPAIANAPIALWARATFFIYITHGFAMAATRAGKVQALLHHSEVAIVAATVVLSTIGGICFYLLWRRVERVPGLLGMRRRHSAIA